MLSRASKDSFSTINASRLHPIRMRFPIAKSLFNAIGFPALDSVFSPKA